MSGDFKIGDADGDTLDPVKVGDLMKAVRIISKGEAESLGQAIRIDVNGDKRLDMKDVRLMWDDLIDGAYFPANNMPVSKLKGTVVNSLPHMGIYYNIPQGNTQEVMEIADKADSRFEEFDLDSIK